MVIHNFNVFSAGGRPPETHPKLVIDTNTMPARSTAFERFQPIAGRYPQIIQTIRDFQLPQLASHDGFYVHEPLNPIALRDGLSVGALECFYHDHIVTQCVINV